MSRKVDFKNGGHVKTMNYDLLHWMDVIYVWNDKKFKGCELGPHWDHC